MNKLQFKTRVLLSLVILSTTLLSTLSRGEIILKAKDLEDHVIVPTLKYLAKASQIKGLYSKDATELLLATAAHESHMGQYLKQHRGGSALGIYQIEPSTHQDILRYLNRADKYLLKKAVYALRGAPVDGLEPLIYDLVYATAIARIKYWMVPEKLPSFRDPKAVAFYWKKYYNTEAGKGTTAKFMDDYFKYCD